MKQLEEDELEELSDDEIEESLEQEEFEEDDASPALKKTVKASKGKKAPKRVMPEMSREQEAQIFKALSHKSYKTVGYEFGLHLICENDTQVRTTVMSIARKVRKAPELYGLSQDTVDVIDEAMAARSLKPSDVTRDNNLANETFRDKLEAIRDKTADMLMKKLKKYDTSKSIDGISVKDLKDLLATAVDKSRLLRGESTENIVKLSKVDTDNMKPEDALKFIMKAREAMIEARQ